DSDPAARSFETHTLPAKITGLPPSAKTLTLQKADGTSFIAIWNEAHIWDAAAAKPMVVAPTSISISSVGGQISVYAPITGMTPIVPPSKQASVTIPLSDEALLVVITPR